MERITGKVKRALRRTRRKVSETGRKFVAGTMSAVLIASAALSALSPVVAYAADDFTSTMTFYTTGDGLEGEGQYAAEDGAIAYCMDMSLPGPGYDGHLYDNGWEWAEDGIAAIAYNGYPYTTTINDTTWDEDTARAITQEALWLYEGYSETDGDYSYEDFLGSTHSGNLIEEFGEDVWDAVLYLYEGAKSGELTAPDGLVRIYASVQKASASGSFYYTVQRMLYCTSVGQLTITKSSDTTSITSGNDCYSLAGAVYTVYDSDGDAVGTLTTNENGKTGTLDLVPGTYTVKETTAPEGYYLDGTTYTVTISEDVTTTLSVTDTPANDPVYLLIGKYDGETTYLGSGNLPQGSASLAGAEFTIEYYDTLDYDSYDELLEAGVEPTRTWVVATDEVGLAYLSEDYLVSGDALYYYDDDVTLPRGTVVIYESKAPEGYVISDDVSFQKIQEDVSTSNVVTYNTVVVAEQVERGGVEVYKTDSETGSTPQGDASLEGITFSIINNNENSVIIDGVEYDSGEVVMTITTDEDGYAATDDDALPYGDYIIRETGTNESYLNTSFDVYVTISGNGTTYTTTASDDVVRGGVEVYKADLESDLSTALGGASLDGTTFEVITLSENPVVVNGVTYSYGDVVATLTIEDGYAATDDDALPYGTYALQEVSVGEGYQLNESAYYEFTIDSDGEIVNPVTGDGHVHNQVKRGDLEFNKKASDTGQSLAGIAFKVTSQTTGESHIIVTDENGYFSSSSDWNAHTSNTNGNDWALEVDGTIDSDELDLTAGVWFGLSTEADDSLGALPYDTYTIEELSCTNNEGYQLITATVTISRDGVTVDYGTLDDQPTSSITVSTNAYDPTDRDTRVNVGTVSIADKVTYSGLTAGGEYKLVTTVVDAETGEALTDADGNTVTASTTFTADSSSGYKIVTMEIPTYELGGTTITVYEELYSVSGSSETLVAEHKDKDDVDQQLDVVSPEIGTTATDGIDGDKNVVTDTETIVVDTVSYTNLIVGEEYTVTGTLYVKSYDEDGNVVEEQLLVDGEPVTASTTFTPETSSGSVEVTFTFDSTGIEAGTEIVAFESLYLDGYEIATHADITDTRQTVTIIEPEIGTSAADGLDGDKNVAMDNEATIVDTVSYDNLVPGKEYTVTGTLMDKATGEALLDADGNEITASTTFTPETSSGSVEVTFTFDSRLLEDGDEVVVFESLYRDGIEIATHADIEDEDQTVTVTEPEIGTTATDGIDGDKNVVYDTEATIVDTVSYDNLVPGKEYTVTGTLYVKSYDEGGNVVEEQLTVPTGETGYEVYNADMDIWDLLTDLFSDLTDITVDEGGTLIATRYDSSTVTYEDGTWREVGLEEPITASTTFTPETSSGTVEVTFTFDATALEDGDEVVVFETLYLGGVEVTAHADIEDEAQTVTIIEPEIGTTATDGIDGDKNVVYDTEATIVDVVEYDNLVPGKEYTVTGTLMDKATGEALLDADGNEITASTTFTPETSSGTVEVTFTFDATLLEVGDEVVVFETLYRDGVEVGTHTDLEDEAQTVTIIEPEIGTSAADGLDGDKNVIADSEAVIVDTVAYSNLVPGKEYTVTGTLYVKSYDEDGNVVEEQLLDADGNEITASTTFTPETPVGSVEVTFTFDSTGIEDGAEIVVFETLYRDGVEVTAHADIEDEEQTVTLKQPDVGTTATDGLDGDKNVIADSETTITDTVEYTGTITGETYTLAGILMDADTGLPILTGEGNELYSDDEVQAFMDALSDVFGLAADEDGNVTLHTTVDVETIEALLDEYADLLSYMVVQTEAFVAEAEDGTMTMDFDFNSNDVIDRLSGETKNVVVFEVLLKGSFDDEDAPIVVAAETDLTNEDQTVLLTPSSIGTTATDASDGDHELMPSQNATIVDTVTYEGLIPGKEYVLEATLMDKATGEALTVNDETVTATLRFTPNSESGTVEIELTFDASELDGYELVVFEELYKQSVIDGETTDILVAVHKDIDDEDQTVTVTSSPSGTTESSSGSTYGKTGGSTIALIVAIVLLLAAAGGLGYYGLKARRAASSESEMGDNSDKDDVPDKDDAPQA